MKLRYLDCIGLSSFLPDVTKNALFEEITLILQNERSKLIPAALLRYEI